MKFLKSIAAIFCISVVLFSCKKDIDFTARLSYGSLQGSGGDCLPKNIHGEYKVGVTLLPEHYIDVHVNIDSVGTYEINTDTINGFSFNGKGTLGIKGDNLIRLYGHGRPLSGGTYTFTINYSGTACTIDVPVSGAVLLPATFTLENTSGECSGAIVNGTYGTGIIVNGDNNAAIKVNVTKAGSYAISTNTVNGIRFSKSGTFTTTGIQTVTLTATGTPTAATTNNYTVTAGTSTCTFSVTAITISAGVFTLGGAGSTCTGAIADGTYTAGTVTTVANTSSIQVNVTTPGSYTISTNTVNGITFSKSGIFTATGAQTVKLTASGTPTAAGTFSYTVSAGGGNCTFSITASGGSTPPPTPTGEFYFQFNDGSKLFSCKSDDVQALLVDALGISMLTINGYSSTGDTAYTISVSTSGAVKTGFAYKTSVLGMPLSTFTTTSISAGVQLYQADFTTTGKTISITFDKIDLTYNKIVSGTFSGTVAKPGGGSATLTNGKFKADLP